jgi:hypothetical protein
MSTKSVTSNFVALAQPHIQYSYTLSRGRNSKDLSRPDLTNIADVPINPCVEVHGAQAIAANAAQGLLTSPPCCSNFQWPNLVSQEGMDDFISKTLKFSEPPLQFYLAACFLKRLP